MRMYDVILKKRHGEILSDEEIKFFIEGYTKGEIPDYQASAFCMAVCFSGMNDEECASLTYHMMNSGDTVDLSAFPRTADKHSTGGVGDKTSLIVAPTVASLGCTVAKMSGRGLGHTGGTIDKLESIPGYRTGFTPEEFMAQVEKIGVAVVGQTGNLVPADKKLYALRDVTATVDSVPLIASSIMSKKLASGAESIVLDVKYGSGAFMKTTEEAEVLAEKMVMIGKIQGRKMCALITDMDKPLGKNIGNSLEVIEAVEGPYMISRCQGDAYSCTRTDCRLHGIYGKISAMVRKELDAISFDTICGDE
ncbi:MAG: thymidine phosphorylase [Clostridia bacterium]|nr:thymidine phosphorylase [Clostridia bacterium]